MKINPLITLAIQSPGLDHKRAAGIVGGLSNPSKMPCFGLSIPAKKCITGKKLRAVKNSVCSICYALKGRYGFANVASAMERRFKALNHPKWVDAMVLLCSTRLHLAGGDAGYFRWHDSGDVQSIDHLSRIVEIAKRVPFVKFWLPTREYSIVTEYLDANGAFPENLAVRVSAYMLDAQPPAWAVKRGLPTSGVSTDDGFNCPAPFQGNQCKDCRECWKTSGNVGYKGH